MNKLLGILGLANKAGALEIGTNNVINAVRNKKAKIVVMASDISSNTKKLIYDKANYRNIRTISLPVKMEELAKALGKNVTSSAAITDTNFVTAIEKQLLTDIDNDSQAGPQSKNITEA